MLTTLYGGKEGTLYKLLMDKIMDCLEKRRAVQKVFEYPYAGFQIAFYERTQHQKRVCPEILEIGMGGQASDLDRLLPLREN